jgi:hypothetical protein
MSDLTAPVGLPPLTVSPHMRLLVDREYSPVTNEASVSTTPWSTICLKRWAKP